MSNYVQLIFEGVSSEQSAILIAQLSDAGFDGFEEEENALKAFITDTRYDETLVCEIAASLDTAFSKSIIPKTNWNKVWESNFEPVIVDDLVAIRAEFHQPVAGVKHEIIITPKMSFGTGHHATTYMMLQEMGRVDFHGKTVFDFGTGTGVLAILAEKLGASKIAAIDNDDWSIRNAAENIARNNCHLIELKKSEEIDEKGLFDIILANINKNVILHHFSAMTRKMTPGGILLLSGLLQEDKDDIFRIKNAYSLQIIDTNTRSNWLCIKLSR